MKKGFVFTMDMLIGMSLAMIIILTFAFLEFESVLPERRYERLDYLTNDIMDALTYLKVRSVQDKPTISRLFQDGTLKEGDLNKTVLDLIGGFWFNENETIAENITREVLEGIANDICFNITIAIETIYSSCNNAPKNIAVGSRIESGYEPGRPTYGYLSRAWATKIKKNTTEIFPFPPEGSGWEGRALEVTKKIELPSGITIINATLWVSIRYGSSQSFPEFMILRINGGENLKNDIRWLYRQQLTVAGETSSANYGFIDITNNMQAGINSVDLKIGSPHFNAHFLPGMRLVVTYSLEEEVREGDMDFSKTYYFDDVIGREGAWATMAFFLPPDSINRDVKIKIRAKDVDATGVLHEAYGEDHTDVEIYLNSEDPIFNDTDPSSDEIYDFDMTNISDDLVDGTNVLSVFLNCYGDVDWGQSDTQIYSDFQNNPSGSSYVNVSYSLTSPMFDYGQIDIVNISEFGINGTHLIYNFSLSPGKSDIIESYTHLVQGFSSMLEEFAWHEGDAQTLVFRSPAVRSTPSSIYIPPNIWGEGDNSIRMRDFQPDGSTSPYNYILPWTTLEYKYLVDGMVGYGNIFNTSDEAVQDAHERLLEQLGDVEIISSQVNMENITVSGIEWLWGPSLFKVVVWEK